MTIEQFCSILNAKRVGKGSYMALCPAHPDRNRSLSIDRGKGPHPFVFQCRSQHCDESEILRAVGLKWSDLLGKRSTSPEFSERVKDERKLRDLASKWSWYMARGMLTKASNLYPEMDALERKLNPEKARRFKLQAEIQRYGIEGLWERFLKTPQGQEVSQKYSLDYVPSMPFGEPVSVKSDCSLSEWTEIAFGSREPVHFQDGYSWHAPSAIARLGRLFER